MIYSVYLDGTSIYGNDDTTILLDPSLDVELNAAGELSFTLPARHVYYDLPVMLTQTVTVMEGTNTIWYGRIISIEKNWNNEKVISCEGALAFFNDTIQRPEEFESINVRTFFSTLISYHNEQVTSTDRQFTVGTVTVDEKFVYRKLNYESTFDCLKTMCLDAEGGYFIFRRENNTNYIDWYKDLPNTGTQPIQYGLNLKDLEQSIDGTDICTCVVPLGAYVDGSRLTVRSVNDSKDYIDSDLISTYGRIIQVKEYNNITDAEELLTEATSWLTDQQFDRLTITCDAADLHYLPGYSSYSAIAVGQYVTVTSTPHGLSKVLPIERISLKLDSGIKEVTIGTPDRRTLTEIYADEGGSAVSSSGYSSSSYSSSSTGDAKTSVTYKQVGSGSMTVGVIYVDDKPYTIYIPANTGGGSVVEWDPTLSSGTGIGTLTIDGTDYTIYAPDAGSEVEWDPTLSSGTGIGTLTIDGTDYTIYAPDAGSEVTWTQLQSTGTKIAEIDIDGTTQDIYAPSSGSGGSNVSYTPALTTGTLSGTLTIDGTDYEIYCTNGGGDISPFSVVNGMICVTFKEG